MRFGGISGGNCNADSHLNDFFGELIYFAFFRFYINIAAERHIDDFDVELFVVFKNPLQAFFDIRVGNPSAVFGNFNQHETALRSDSRINAVGKFAVTRTRNDRLRAVPVKTLRFNIGSERFFFAGNILKSDYSFSKIGMRIKTRIEKSDANAAARKLRVGIQFASRRNHGKAVLVVFVAV